jgi:hypothetical protein
MIPEAATSYDRKSITRVQVLLDSKRSLLANRQSKDTLDAGLIDYAKLNMRPGVKARAFVKFGPFNKQGSDRLPRLDRRIEFGHLAACAMKVFDHCAIEVAPSLLRTGVPGERIAKSTVEIHQPLVSRFHRQYPFLGAQIQAPAGIDDRSH